MSRLPAIAMGLAAGAVAAAAVLLVLSSWSRGPGGEESPPPVTVPVDQNPAAEPPPASSKIRTQTVTIYQRAATEELMLSPVKGEIVWFPDAVERAEEIVRLVLEGVPGARGVLLPAGMRLEYREVFIDGQGTAWVDLEAGDVSRVQGSDAEQALVAALARSLVEDLDEVRAVGILVGGEPRRTLAGHVDLGRTYRGTEWPVVGEEEPAHLSMVPAPGRGDVEKAA